MNRKSRAIQKVGKYGWIGIKIEEASKDPLLENNSEEEDDEADE